MKASNILIGVLVGVVVLAAGGVAGYYVSHMQKQTQIEAAKQQATADAQKAAEAEKAKAAEDAKHQAQAKTHQETTCNADELVASVVAGSDSGAGTLAYDLVLKNTSNRTCTLGGFPGVSLVNENGNMIGTPAERATNYAEPKLTLAPNTSVKAVMSVSNNTNFDSGVCKDGATKVRVYPPNDTGYLSVPSPVEKWCPGFMISPVLEG